MLRRSEQHHFYNEESQKIIKARQEAEALFQPKPRHAKPSISAELPQTGSSVRQPRILSASTSSEGRPIAEAPTSPKPPTKFGVSGLQLARIHRDQLENARGAIFKQQDKLQAKMDAIDCELRAIDAYEAAKNGKSSLSIHFSKEAL